MRNDIELYTDDLSLPHPPPFQSWCLLVFNNHIYTLYIASYANLYEVPRKRITWLNVIYHNVGSMGWDINN